MTDAILDHLRALGYAVSVHRMTEYVELHAVLVRDPELVPIARCERDDDEAVYLAACELAGMCGVELEDG